MSEACPKCGAAMELDEPGLRNSTAEDCYICTKCGFSIDEDEWLRRQLVAVNERAEQLQRDFDLQASTQNTLTDSLLAAQKERDEWKQFGKAVLDEAYKAKDTFGVCEGNECGDCENDESVPCEDMAKYVCHVYESIETDKHYETQIQFNAALADNAAMAVDLQLLARACRCLEPDENGNPVCDPPCVACRNVDIILAQSHPGQQMLDEHAKELAQAKTDLEMCRVRAEYAEDKHKKCWHELDNIKNVLDPEKRAMRGVNTDAIPVYPSSVAVAEMIDELDKVKNIVICGFCSMESDRRVEGWETLMADHIYGCDKHPLRRTMTHNDILQAAVDTLASELQSLRAVVEKARSLLIECRSDIWQAGRRESFPLMHRVAEFLIFQEKPCDGNAST
jgi:hypothetical protein